MKSDDAKGLLFLVVGAGAVYLLWQMYQKIFGSGGLTDKGATALANWYVQLTAGGYAIPTGYVLLPDGSSVSTAAIPGGIQNVPNTNSAVFSYNGTTYYLNSPHDSNGNWAASTSLGA